MCKRIIEGKVSLSLLPAIAYFISYVGITSFLIAYAVGIFGYAAGPTLHIIDAQGLGDAFLARTPGVAVHPGHYPRHVPDGYPTGDTSKFTPE